MNISATKKLLMSSLARTSQIRKRCTNNIDSYHHTIGSVMPPVSSEPGAVTLVNMRSIDEKDILIKQLEHIYWCQNKRPMTGLW